jgi:predicted anti-sigma-YlaC factor YlaD
MRFDIDCKEMARLISDSQDSPMPPAERTRMRMHLVLCEACRNVDDQMGFLRRTMRQLGREQTQHPAVPGTRRTQQPDQTGE